MRKKTSFEREVDQSMREIDYAGGKMLWRVILVIVIFTILSGVIWAISKRTSVEVERETFKESTAYNEAAAQFLAKSLREYNQKEDPDEKQAICEYVVQTYPNLNSDHIKDEKLRNFYIMCISGGPGVPSGSEGSNTSGGSGGSGGQ